MKLKEIVFGIIISSLILGANCFEEDEEMDEEMDDEITLDECEDLGIIDDSQTTFESAQIDTTVITYSVHLSDTILIPLDTLVNYDSISVSQPDSILLLDLDSVLSKSEFKIESVELEEVDSINFQFPDTIFVFDSFLSDSLALDTVYSQETINNENIVICIDDVGQDVLDKIEGIKTFLGKVVGSWRSESTACVNADGIFDVSTNYELFSLRIDYRSITTTTLNLNYFSAFGQPIFNRSGTISISISDTDFLSSNIDALLDDSLDFSFEDINSSSEEELIFSIQDGIDCSIGSPADRVKRLGRARFRTRRF